MAKQIPIVDYLVLGDGDPHLEAWESVDSGALYFDRRNADAKSGGTEFRRRRLESSGTVRSFTIVHRGVPGIPVPVRLGAGRPRRRWRGEVEPHRVRADPEAVALGMRVKMTTFVAGTDDDGTEAVAFAFEPA